MSDLQALTAQIVESYVEANKVPAESLPDLIAAVYGALAGTEKPAAPEAEVVEKPTAHQIRKSIQPEHLVSFLDGKSYKTLKRHLTTHGLTFEAYRERFGLPKDYPTVAPSYSAQRSALAKQLGLGSKGRGGGKAAAEPAKGKGAKKGR
jgi:predicted transcriptional regulator